MYNASIARNPDSLVGEFLEPNCLSRSPSRGRSKHNSFWSNMWRDQSQLRLTIYLTRLLYVKDSRRTMWNLGFKLIILLSFGLGQQHGYSTSRCQWHLWDRSFRGKINKKMFLEVATILWNWIPCEATANRACSNDFIPHHSTTIIPFDTWQHSIGNSVSIRRVFWRAYQLPTTRRSSSMIRAVQQAAYPRPMIKIIQRRKTNARTFFFFLLQVENLLPIVLDDSYISSSVSTLMLVLCSSHFSAFQFVIEGLYVFISIK